MLNLTVKGSLKPFSKLKQQHRLPRLKKPLRLEKPKPNRKKLKSLPPVSLPKVQIKLQNIDSYYKIKKDNTKLFYVDMKLQKRNVNNSILKKTEFSKKYYTYMSKFGILLVIF